MVTRMVHVSMYMYTWHVHVHVHMYIVHVHVHVHVVLSTLFSATVQLYSISKAGAALVGAQKYKTCLLRLLTAVV